MVIIEPYESEIPCLGVSLEEFKTNARKLMLKQMYAHVKAALFTIANR